MTNVLIAGGSGLVGSELTRLLSANGYPVRWLSRNPANTPVPAYSWDPDRHTVPAEALEWADTIVNLAGASIVEKRWTDARKKILIGSRSESAETLRLGLLALPADRRPRTYIGASAVGYYGNRGEEILTETSSPGEGFTTESTRIWEADHQRLSEELGLRSVILRIGIVLSRKGGALPEIERPLRFGIGGYFADGRSWYPWIHIYDQANMIRWAIQNPQARGTYNAVAPNPIRNIDLVRAIGRARGQRAIYAPVPSFMLKIMLGERAAIILNSIRVSSAKIERDGFSFQFTDIDTALLDLYRTPAP